MNISPYLRQLFVASSPQLAAFSVGGIVGFPTVLLQQLKENSSITTDLDTLSWIASVHGIAGIPSLLLSLLMQWKGRKTAFILSSSLIIIGWSLMLIATKATDIIIAESFQGFGGNSIVIVSLLTISEMVAPDLRPLSLVLYSALQTTGVVFISLIGYCLHWKSVSLVMLVPIVLALMLACTWPESPSWLACKGEFERCEQAFRWLRGDNEDTQKELTALINAQKRALSKRNAMEEKGIAFFQRIRRRDFYLPSIHIFLILATYYWSGGIAMYIYTVQIVQHTTGISSDFLPMALSDSVIIFACFISIVLVRKYNNKTLLITGGFGCTLSLLTSVVTLNLQIFGLLSLTSPIILFFVLVYGFFCTVGLTNVVFAICAELMPVKHRGIGGVFYTIYLAILHTTSIKTAPYLIVYIDYWGMFLLYASVSLLGTLLIWKYVPETKNRTLQEIEDYYNRGSFDKCLDLDEPLVNR